MNYQITAELRHACPKLGLEAGDEVTITSHDENTVTIVADSITLSTIKVEKYYIKLPKHVELL